MWIQNIAKGLRYRDHAGASFVVASRFDHQLLEQKAQHLGAEKLFHLIGVEIQYRLDGGDCSDTAVFSGVCRAIRYRPRESSPA